MIKKILVCTNYRANPNNPSCAARGSKVIASALTRQLQKKKILIELEEIQCLGYCNIGPNVRLIPNGEFFHEVSDKNLIKIIQATKIFLES
jgi:NADH:ubiquinone oxidoreductase subunit E